LWLFYMSLAPSLYLSPLNFLYFQQETQNPWYYRHKVGSTDMLSLLEFRQFTVLPTQGRKYLKDRNGEPERGEWMGADKILLEGDRGSNKMNTASNTRLWLNYPSWSRPRSHRSATDPRNQQTTFWARTHQHAQRKLARLATCATPVRPMAYAG
jgi:hypothetical protein